MKKGIYLAAYRAYHPDYNLDYCDIRKTSDNINVVADMLSVDLSLYDYVIATPPCNFWSRATGINRKSEYALSTKHLLLEILPKLIKLNKPFLIENVRNFPLFHSAGLIRDDIFIYYVGRHTYWSNVLFDIDIVFSDKKIQETKPSERESDIEVFQIVENFLKKVHADVSIFNQLSFNF